MNKPPPDLILHNGKIATQDDRRALYGAPEAESDGFSACDVGRGRSGLRADRLHHRNDAEANRANGGFMERPGAEAADAAHHCPILIE